MKPIALLTLAALLLAPATSAQDTPTMTGNGSAEAPYRPAVGLAQFVETPEKFESVPTTLKGLVVSPTGIDAGEFYAIAVYDPETGTRSTRVPGRGELVFVISPSQYRQMRAKLPTSDSYLATVWFTVESGKSGETKIWLARVTGIQFFHADGRTAALIGPEE